MQKSNLLIHFIDERTDMVLRHELAVCAPSVGDEIRIGGLGRESYYTVVRLVWVYDEPENPHHRVNIAVTKSDV